MAFLLEMGERLEVLYNEILIGVFVFLFVVYFFFLITLSRAPGLLLAQGTLLIVLRGTHRDWDINELVV